MKKQSRGKIESSSYTVAHKPMKKPKLDKSVIEKLTVYKPHYYLIYLLMTVSTIVAATQVGLYFDVWYVYIVCCVFSGIAYLGFANAAHECVHGLLCPPNKQLNDLVGKILMSIFFINYTIHSSYHLTHHAFTTQKGDPEGNYEYNQFHSLKSYLLSMCKWLTIFDPVHFLNYHHAWKALRNQKTELLNNSRKLAKARRTMLVMIAWLLFSVICTFYYPKAWLIGYWLPVIFCTPLAAYITALPEHYDVNCGKDTMQNTRTILCHPLVSHLFWRFNYHTAHHHRANVPFYSLKKLHEEIATDVNHYTKSYIGFHFKLFKSLFVSSTNR